MATLRLGTIDTRCTIVSAKQWIPGVTTDFVSSKEETTRCANVTEKSFETIAAQRAVVVGIDWRTDYFLSDGTLAPMLGKSRPRSLPYQSDDVEPAQWVHVDIECKRSRSSVFEFE